MYRFLFIGMETLPAVAAILPVFVLLKRRMDWSSRRTVCCILLSLYLAAVYTVVGLPNVTYVRFEPNFNFEPFAYMFSDLDSTLLNVLLFIPWGLALPFFWQAFKPFWKTMLLGFGLSVLIETLQIFTFRATDVNDLMTNTFGTLIGWQAARLILRFVPALKPGEKTAELPMICGVTFGIMFFLHPFLSSLVWSIFR